MALPPSIELLLRRSERGVGQINARTGAKRTALAPYASRADANYAPAIESQQALGRATQSGLVSQGNQLAGGIEAALSGIQAPGQAVATHAGGTQATGQAAGQAAGALSSADLGRLRGYSTAEQVYAAALPRLAQLAGEQERRGFLQQAQQELADLSLREAQQAAEMDRYNREWAYKVRQDQLDRARQGKLDRIERSRYRSETKYERNQDRREAERQAMLDALAQQAAAQEYGLNISEFNAERQYEQQTLAERQRSARERERIQRERIAAQRERDVKGGGNDDVFYDVREAAFERAREYAATLSERRPSKRITRATAAKRMWQEFGTALTGRGYKPKVVRQMIERALDAAGY